MKALNGFLVIQNQCLKASSATFVARFVSW